MTIYINHLKNIIMGILKNVKTDPMQNPGSWLDKCNNPIPAVVAIATLAIVVIRDIAGSKK